MVKLSVIIPCYNGASTLAVQLEALANQTWQQPWEIIVANNGSTDASVAIVEDYQKRLPHLRLVDASARRGQPYALNTGAEAARGESLAFCDADDEVGPGWVAAMGEALCKYDFVACRMDVEKLNEPWMYQSRGQGQQFSLQQYRYPPYLSHAGGGTLGVKRSLHEAVGGFDETLPYLHDTDYCWRLQLRGIELHFVPDAVIYIRFRNSLKAVYRQARSYAEYNVILYKRYRPLGMPSISLKRSLKAWIRMLEHSFRIRSKADLARWIWNFGWWTGRLWGSVKHRVWAL